MTFPGAHAREKPDHPAVVMAGRGETLTYRELDERSNQLAHLWHERGLRRGDRYGVTSAQLVPTMFVRLLKLPPAVADVAVFGVPNEDLGEEVKAVVQLLDPAGAGPELEARLLTFCREHLASFKCPRTIDFDTALPRQDTGKLDERLLKDRCWGDRASRIV